MVAAATWVGCLFGGESRQGGDACAPSTWSPRIDRPLRRRRRRRRCKKLPRSTLARATLSTTTAAVAVVAMRAHIQAHTSGCPLGYTSTRSRIRDARVCACTSTRARPHALTVQHTYDRKYGGRCVPVRAPVCCRGCPRISVHHSRLIKTRTAVVI